VSYFTIIISSLVGALVLLVISVNLSDKVKTQDLHSSEASNSNVIMINPVVVIQNP